ncbi:MAG TPA: hypothetical protein VF384_01800 [Planctomycetota bacterium]
MQTTPTTRGHQGCARAARCCRTRRATAGVTVRHGRRKARPSGATSRGAEAPVREWRREVNQAPMDMLQ